MNASDLQSIEHLDFDIQTNTPPKCEGTAYWEREKLSGVVHELEDRRCSNQAKLLCFRACCGHAEQLCLDCYNHMCHSKTDCRFCWGRDKTAKWYSQVVPL